MVVVIVLFILLCSVQSFKNYQRTKYRYHQHLFASNEETVWEGSIGQDVCGSKYNDDPFDAVDNKKSGWDIMQEKIKALELKRNNGTKPVDANSGKWP